MAGRGDDVPADSFLGLPIATSQMILYCGHGIKFNEDFHNTYFPFLSPPCACSRAHRVPARTATPTPSLGSRVSAEWQLAQLGCLFSPPFRIPARPAPRTGRGHSGAVPAGSGARRRRFCLGTRRAPRGPIRSASGGAGNPQHNPGDPGRAPGPRCGAPRPLPPLSPPRRRRRSGSASRLPHVPQGRRRPEAAGGRAVRGRAGPGAAVGQAPGPR